MALNNESIVEKDLVAWVMLGIVHVPRSEVRFLSLPKNTQYHSSVLSPRNPIPCPDFRVCNQAIGLQKQYWLVPNPWKMQLGWRAVLFGARVRLKSIECVPWYLGTWAVSLDACCCAASFRH